MTAGEYEIIFQSKFGPPAVTGWFEIVYRDDGFYPDGREKFKTTIKEIYLKIDSRAQESPSEFMLKRAPFIEFKSTRIDPRADNGVPSATRFRMEGKLIGAGFERPVADVPLEVRGAGNGVSADVTATLDLKSMNLGAFGPLIFRLMGGHTVEVDLSLRLTRPPESKLAHRPAEKPLRPANPPTKDRRVTTAAPKRQAVEPTAAKPALVPPSQRTTPAKKKTTASSSGKKSALPKKLENWDDVREALENMREKLNRR